MSIKNTGKGFESHVLKHLKADPTVLWADKVPTFDCVALPPKKNKKGDTEKPGVQFIARRTMADFHGVMEDGRALVVEAKSTQAYAVLRPHQYGAIVRSHKAGAVAFVIVEFLHADSVELFMGPDVHVRLHPGKGVRLGCVSKWTLPPLSSLRES